jgi:TonB family protein
MRPCFEGHCGRAPIFGCPLAFAGLTFSDMKPCLFPLTLTVAAAGGFFASVAGAQTQAQTQAAPGVTTPDTRVALTNLSSPVYPPLARQARIMGDVTIQIHIRKDGKVESAEVVSGPAMLKQAALESAQKSTFECEGWSSGVFVVGCRDAVTSFTLIYTFGIRDDLDGLDCTITRARSRKCLYLWACGLWRRKDPRKPAVGHSLDHVMILADPTCVDTATGS